MIYDGKICKEITFNKQNKLIPLILTLILQVTPYDAHILTPIHEEPSIDEFNSLGIGEESALRSYLRLCDSATIRLNQPHVFTYLEVGNPLRQNQGASEEKSPPLAPGGSKHV